MFKLMCLEINAILGAQVILIWTFVKLLAKVESRQQNSSPVFVITSRESQELNFKSNKKLFILGISE